MDVGDWIVPMNGKEIVRIVAVENYAIEEVQDGIIPIYFTSDGRAYEREDFITMDEAYQYEKLIEQL
jgi:hypothetical protein